MFIAFSIYVIIALAVFLYLFCIRPSDERVPIWVEFVYIIVMTIIWPLYIIRKMGDPSGF